LGSASTRSPIATLLTPSPRASTTPATSAPGVNGIGGFTWYSPRHMSTSGKFSDAACTRRRTSPRRGAGTSTSSRTSTASGSPSSWARRAFTARSMSAELLFELGEGFVFADVQREAQLRDQDASSSDQHRLLARGKTLRHLAQGEVPHDF